MESLSGRLAPEMPIDGAPLALILDALPIGVGVLDPEGAFTFANRAMAELLDEPEEELVGRRLTDWLRPAWAYQAGRWLPGQGPALLPRPPGPPWDVRLTVAAWGELPSRWIVLLEDVREAKRVRSRLYRQETLAQLGRLAATVIHEVGNPLQAVRACVDLQAELLEQEGIRGEYLRIVGQEIQRLQELLARYRDLYRPGQEIPKEVDLSQVAEEVLSLARPFLSERGLEVKAELAPEPTTTLLSHGETKQLLLNLVLNAQQAMPQGGRLWVRTRASARGVELEVEDTGSGIEPSRLGPLFEEGSGEDIGLGLYIARSVAEKQGGHIEVESKDGAGSLFRVVFRR